MKLSSLVAFAVKKLKKEVTHEIKEEFQEDIDEDIEEEEDISNDSPKSAKEHALQLQRLQEKVTFLYIHICIFLFLCCSNGCILFVCIVSIFR